MLRADVAGLALVSGVSRDEGDAATARDAVDGATPVGRNRRRGEDEVDRLTANLESDAASPCVTAQPGFV